MEPSQPVPLKFSLDLSPQMFSCVLNKDVMGSLHAPGWPGCDSVALCPSEDICSLPMGS